MRGSIRQSLKVSADGRRIKGPSWPTRIFRKSAKTGVKDDSLMEARQKADSEEKQKHENFLIKNRIEGTTLYAEKKDPNLQPITVSTHQSSVGHIVVMSCVSAFLINRIMNVFINMRRRDENVRQ